MSAEANNDPGLHNERVSAEARDFWQERSYIADAPNFAEQLHEAEADPKSRATVIKSRPEFILNGERSRLEFTEAEGLLNLHQFLASVREIASAHDDKESAGTAQSVANFEAKFSFIGKQEFDTACRGLAQMWAEYVKQGPDFVLNVYHVSNKDDRKSTGFVLAAVRAQLADIIDDPETAERVRIGGADDWIETDHAKLLVVEDWAVSGSVARNLASRAVYAAKSRGLHKLASALELHLLVARENQIAEGGLDMHDDFHIPIRSYYLADSAGPFEVVPSGFHSSVDYGFEDRLKDFQDYVKKQGLQLELPWLTHIDRAYRPIEYSTDEANIIRQLAETNGRVAELRNRIKNLMDSERKLGINDSQERNDLFEQIGAIEEELGEKRREQFRLSEVYSEMARASAAK